MFSLKSMCTRGTMKHVPSTVFPKSQEKSQCNTGMDPEGGAPGARPPPLFFWWPMIFSPAIWKNEQIDTENTLPRCEKAMKTFSFLSFCSSAFPTMYALPLSQNPGSAPAIKYWNHLTSWSYSVISSCFDIRVLW